jgi:hypothetical protein
MSGRRTSGAWFILILLGAATCAREGPGGVAVAPRRAEPPPQPRQRPHAAPPWTRSIPREEIARRAAPSTFLHTRRLLYGHWSGKRYGYEPELGFTGTEGDAAPRWLELHVGSRYRMVHESRCTSSGRWRLDRAASARFELRLFRTQSNCAGAAEPHDYPLEIHRLDRDILVLIDGATGGLSAYRRVPRDR